MLYRYILALTLGAMCTVNGDEEAAQSEATTAPSTVPTAPSISPTASPITLEEKYLIQSTQTLPCCSFHDDLTVVLDTKKCGETTYDACNATAFTADSTFNGQDMAVTVADPVIAGETCNCVYTFKRFEYTLTAPDPSDGFAAREMVSSGHWPQLLDYAEWTQGQEAIEPVKNVACDSMYVTACLADQTCAGHVPSEDAAVNAKQLPDKMTVGESTKTLIDYGKSQEIWPLPADNTDGDICFCFWLYRDMDACPPTPAPTDKPDDDVMTTVVDDDEETGGAANHSLTVAALLLAASAIFTAF